MSKPTIPEEVLSRLIRETYELKAMHDIIIKAHHVDVEKLSQERDQAIADVKKLREDLKALRDCDVPFEHDTTQFLSLREMAAQALEDTKHYDA